MSSPPAASESDYFALIQRAIDGEVVPRGALHADIHRRLYDAIHDAAAHPVDRAGLTRQVLRRTGLARSANADVFIDVPNGGRWPTQEVWLLHSCSALPIPGDRLRIRAEEWTPDWLGKQARGLDNDAVMAGLDAAARRPEEGAAADPFFTDTLGASFVSYRNHGQRQATRAAAWLAPGATLMISLPTGSGKTEVALAPSLFWARNRGVSVIFVPTVSLAQDMDRRVRQVLSRSGSRWNTVAFTGETDTSDRQRISDGVRSGSLPLVITSPESGCGALRPALRDAAANGYLRYFIVDEAHLVREWGTDFRPDLQGLAGLRRELLLASPGGDTRCRTLLLSATFSEADLGLLHHQFSDDGLFEVVAANGLRPEPDYWFSTEPDEDTRRAHVLEAIRHLPRPTFLYTSWVDDADQWVECLRTEGMSRVARVTGSVPGAERAEVLRGLRGDAAPTAIDVVVATSAFGLGISFDAVRSVVHACLPESIDRLYQEVGRAGRDGNAALALVAWTPDDKAKAGPLSRTVVIGWKKAKKRWEAMVEESSMRDGSLIADLTAVPEHGERKSDLNESWNRITLALMTRAKFIRYTSADSQELDSPASGGRRWARRAAVTVMVGTLAQDAVWAAAWIPLRDEIRTTTEGRRSLVEKAVGGARVCDVLVEAFAVSDVDRLAQGSRGLVPARSCGQCGACRPQARVVTRVPEPNPLPTRLALGGAANSADDQPTLVLTRPPSSQRQLVEIVTQFLEASLHAGARLLVLPAPLRSLPIVAVAHRSFGRPVLVADYESDFPWDLPQVQAAVVTALDGSPVDPVWTSDTWLPQSRVLVSTNTPNPARPDRTVDDVRPPGSIRLEDWRGGA